MNKAITDGVVLMPPSFANGLNVWSSGDGTPGSDTYANAANAAFVPADQDFGSCLEVQKIANTTRLRYMGETPLLPGCYLQITARIKVISGSLPNVRVAAFAGRSGGNAVTGIPLNGASTTLTDYGEVYEIKAIVGAGDRTGVDMIWGSEPIYGHFGIDLTGPNGGIVRIDDIEIEDVTSFFLRDLISVVDVRDYGAIGDGTTDNSAAFDRANTAANGRLILVPPGVYRLNSDVTLEGPVRFEGTVTMPTDKVLLLTTEFHLPAYIDAFGNEELAFKKGFQALLNNSDHEALDLRGRKVFITEPIDMQAAVPDRTSYATRRVIRNGQLEAASGGDWATTVVNSQATYDPADSRTLTAVSNIASVEVGSLVEGAGVGREIYVRSKNVSTGEITLNKPLYDAEGRQNFKFSRFKYLVDFSGFSSLSKFVFDDIEFQCNGVCSGILLSPGGSIFHIRDCFVTRPLNRGVTSHGSGCQGIFIDRCQFLSNEDAEDVSDRQSIGFNINANDPKIRDNRATRFRHFGLFGGSNNVISGNHFFQGDSVANGVRSAGFIFASGYTSSVVSANYIDNCYIEWTNEHDSTPDFTAGFSFSSMTISSNVFLSGDVAPWFSYIVVKPFGTGHFLNGLAVTGNKFRSIQGNIDRVDRVDTSFADLDRSRFKLVDFTGNSYNGVEYQVSNPLRIKHQQNTAASTWVIETEGRLPFEGYAIGVDSVTFLERTRNANNVAKYQMPHVELREGPNQDRAHVVWGEDQKGEVQIALRIDD
ncbi:glycosyl hydrolase family 28-related protein [Ascidiaceihabitans sp.]|uniref:glycosyl hydrolase family 28-related protein n=1 Tax=Ascidiaceihabitans sp. TaxID=1872644 RepID=UPI003297756E